MARQPIRDGWRVLRRAPEVVLAEIVWRWVFGATMWVLLIVSFHTYFSSIEISRGEYETLKAFEPFTWIAVTVRVLHAVDKGLRTMGPVLLPALALLWIALATAGRVITVRALSLEKSDPNWTTSFALHALRVLLLASAVLAYFGAGVIIGNVFNPQTQFAASASLSLLAMLLIASIWGVLNWMLSVAAIFTAKDGAGIKQSLSNAADLSSTGQGAINIWFGMMRTAALIAISYFPLFLLPVTVAGGWRAPLILVALLSICYFAFADFLYVWRLAAYIGLTEPETQVQEEAPPPQLFSPEGVLTRVPAPPTQAEPAAPVEPSLEPLKADS